MSLRCLTVCLGLVLVCAGCQNSAFHSKVGKRSLRNDEKLADHDGAWDAEDSMVAAEYDEDAPTTERDQQTEVATAEANIAAGDDLGLQKIQKGVQSSGRTGGRTSGSASVENLLSTAHAASADGRTEDAKRKYEQILEIDPHHAIAHHRLAVIADNEEEFSAAQAHYRAALRNAPEDTRIQSEMHSDLGYSYLLQNKLDQAEDELQRAVQLHPTYSIALNNLGLLYGKRQDYDRALAMFRRGGASEAVVQANMRKLFPDGPPTTNVNVQADLLGAGTRSNPFAPQMPDSPGPLPGAANVDATASSGTHDNDVPPGNFGAFPGGSGAGVSHSAGFVGSATSEFQENTRGPSHVDPQRPVRPITGLGPAATAAGIPQATPIGISQFTPSQSGPRQTPQFGSSSRAAGSTASAWPAQPTEPPGTGQAPLQAPVLPVANRTGSSQRQNALPTSSAGAEIPWQEPQQAADLPPWPTHASSQNPVQHASYARQSAASGPTASYASGTGAEMPGAGSNEFPPREGTARHTTLSPAQRDALFAGMTAGGLFPVSPAEDFSVPPAGNMEPPADGTAQHAMHAQAHGPQPAASGAVGAGSRFPAFPGATPTPVSSAQPHVPAADYGPPPTAMTAETGGHPSLHTDAGQRSALNHFNAEVHAINSGINSGSTDLDQLPNVTPYRRQRPRSAEAYDRSAVMSRQ